MRLIEARETKTFKIILSVYFTFRVLSILLALLFIISTVLFCLFLLDEVPQRYTLFSLFFTFFAFRYNLFDSFITLQYFYNPKNIESLPSLVLKIPENFASLLEIQPEAKNLISIINTGTVVPKPADNIITNIERVLWVSGPIPEGYYREAICINKNLNGSGVSEPSGLTGVIIPVSHFQTPPSSSALALSASVRTPTCDLCGAQVHLAGEAGVGIQYSSPYGFITLNKSPLEES